MNIISFLMPTAKSADAGGRTPSSADAQAGSGFAAMLAQVLGSLGVPVRSEQAAAALPEPDVVTETGDDAAEGGAAPVPASGESDDGETVEEGGLDAIARRTPGASDAAAVVGAERVAGVAFGDVRRTQPEPIQPSESASTARMPAIGSLLRDAGQSKSSHHRPANADRMSLGQAATQPDRAAADPRRTIVAGPAQQLAADDATRAPSAVRYDAPSSASPVLPDHTIESVTSASSKDIASGRHTVATPNAAAEKLTQMTADPPIDAGAKPIHGRQPLPSPQGEAPTVPAARVNADLRSSEPEAEAAVPARGEMSAQRMIPIAEPPLPRMMNAPAGTGEAAMAREAPELPQQADAPKGAFESVSLRVNNADGTPTRIRVAVRGDEVRTTIIENDAGTAQRMVSRGDDLQQSLAARGFSKTSLSVHMPVGRVPDIAVASPMYVDRSDAGSTPDGRADRDGERAPQRDQAHDRSNTDRERRSHERDESRSRQRSRREPER